MMDNGFAWHRKVEAGSAKVRIVRRGVAGVQQWAGSGFFTEENKENAMERKSRCIVPGPLRLLL
jgi:hypothetical protein